MKFGQSLHQRSIPEWAQYNIDYNDIKHLIKERTTKDRTNAVAVPGQSTDGFDQKFENEILGILKDQHARINLFTKSKYGEIERRLVHFQKQVNRLSQWNDSNFQTSRPIQQTSKFAQLVEGANSAGEELQSLSRFVGAQRLAFKKLLKKYRKWTESSNLEKRFNGEVLNQPTNYLEPDFDPLLELLMDVQAALREITDLNSTGKTRQRGHSDNVNTSKHSDLPLDHAQSNDSAAKLHRVSENGSDVGFDSVLATLPLGLTAGKATYWIHADNLIEVRVLLLQYMKDLSAKSRSSISRDSSSSSLSSQQVGLTRGDGSPTSTSDTMNLAAFDDLTSFVRQSSGAAVSDMENSPGAVSEQAAVSARWTSDSDALVVVLENSTEKPKSKFSSPIKKRVRTTARLKRKNLPSLFQPDQPGPKPSSKGSRNGESGTEQSLQSVKDLVAGNSNIKPLVHIQSKRTRLAGLNNSSESGMWAALDLDILMQRIDPDRIGTNDIVFPQRRYSGDVLTAAPSSFPHAVLEIRWETARLPRVIRVLDQSHLVKRLRGFSLETHAVCLVCKPQKMPEPFWIPLLEKDIRKVPSPRPVTGRRSISSQIDSRQNSISAPSTDGPSGSGFSMAPVESSATSVRDSAVESPPTPATKKKKYLPKHRSSAKIGDEEAPTNQRYWNEFDDGDEAPENEPYTIFIDPNAPSTFPGAETVSKFFFMIGTNARLGGEKLKSWLIPASEEDNDVRRPLLNGHHRTSSGIDDSSDSEEDLIPPEQCYMAYNRRHASTTSRASSRSHRLQSREKALFRSYVGCFVASFSLLIISAILTSTGKRKAAFQVDLGVIVGVVSALSFGIVGTSLVLVRKEKLSWLHRVAVFLAFAVVCIASGVLLAVIGASTAV